MAARPLNDEEVLSEMNKMVAFIKQEAMEKAREIKVKADEEFAIEKAKLVKQEQQAIDAQYEKKRKGAEVAQKIAQSNLTNKSRLKLLHRREEQLQELFATARSQILTLGEEGRYLQFLEGVIVQGYLQLMESKVTLIVREKDTELVQKAGEAAAETYTQISGKRVGFDVESILSNESSAGGIKLISGSKRITIDNTLDERLRLLEDRMLPEIRRDLFGPNENRKFYT
ncbi:ATPase V1/A1 complex subunit E [Gyrodon lividus]|nr:ATPase V1/A1 complex subunit E [Gyrodon lividus]